MRSANKVEEIRKQLEKIYDDVGKAVLMARVDTKNKLTKREEERYENSEEIKKIHRKLRLEDYEDMVKRRLPLSVRLFNKIKCVSSHIYKENLIVSFTIGNGDSRFYYVFSVEDFSQKVNS